jgi:threonyl-tRNA synthetase
MIKITLPDGSVREFEKGITPMEIAKNISEGFARNVISAKFNTAIIESSTPLHEDGSLVLYTWKDKEGKTAFCAGLGGIISWSETNHRSGY